MRSEANTVDCEDPVVALACLDPEADMYKECPAACREDDSKTEDGEVVKSGDLAVTAIANNGKAILSAGVSDMDTLTFKTSEEVAISKVVLERYGYSKNENVDRLRLEDENGVIISNVAEGLNAKGQATLTLKKDYRNVDGTLNATIVIDANADAGNTIGFKVIDVTSSAKNVDLGDYSPYTYNVVTYDGADLILTVRGSAKTYNYEAGESYEVAKFKLKAPTDSAINVRSFTLTDGAKNAIEYDEFVENVKVTVAGKEVKSTWSVNRDDELVINLDVELAAKENAEFVVSIELADDFDKMGESVNFYIAGSEDISATDAKTSSRVLVKALTTDEAGNHPNYQGVKEEWPTYTFEGGKITITSEKLGNVEASEDSTDIVIAQGEITTSQSIKMDRGDLKIKVTNSNGKVVSALRLEIAGDEYEGSFNSGTNTYTFPAIEVDESGKIKILVDTVVAGNENDYATFKIDGLKNFYYVDSKTTGDVAGSINISRLTLTPSKAKLSNTISSEEVEFKAGESSEQKTIFKGTYTSKKKDVNLNKFTLEGEDWDYANEMTVYLYIDGKNVADSEFANGKASDTFSNVLVKAGESVSIEVKAQIDAAEYDYENETGHLVDSVKFDLTLEGEDENGNDKSGVDTESTAKVSVVKKGTPEIETGKAKKTVAVRNGSDAIAEFIVKPSGSSSIDLESISFVKPEGVACTGLTLEGDVDEDLTEVDGKCVANGFVEPVSEKGITVKVVFEKEPGKDSLDTDNGLLEVSITGLVLNDTEVSDEFNKAYAEGTIKFSQSGSKDTETTYVVEEIKGYKSSAKISEVVFYDKDGKPYESSNGTKTLSKGDKFTIVNKCNGNENIAFMTYKVTEGNDAWMVKVDYATYEDYFTPTAGGDRLKVFDSGKDSCTSTENINASGDEFDNVEGGKVEASTESGTDTPTGSGSTSGSGSTNP